MKPFEILSEKEEYQDGKRFSVVRAHVRLPDEREVDWAYIKQNDAVVVIALDKNKICIEKQWRLGRNDFAYELPSGWIETPDATSQDILKQAQQELEEEAGVRGSISKIIDSFYLSNHGNTKFHVVLITDIQYTKTKREKNEFLETEFVSIAEAFTRLLNNQIPTAQVKIALNAFKEYQNDSTKE